MATNRRSRPNPLRYVGCTRPFLAFIPHAPEAQAKAIHVEIHDGSREKREHLTHDQPSDNGDTQWTCNSEPVPRPNAAQPARRAAIVVIMIGRKRRMHAW